MIISINAEKASVKIQHPFIKKPLSKLRTEKDGLHLVKGIYLKHTVNITLGNEILNAFLAIIINNECYTHGLGTF